MQAVAEILDFPDAATREAGDERRHVVAAAAGDARAFEKLYRRHAARIHGLCLRLTGQRETAEDCVQEAFISAWRSLPRFEARSSFATWLHRIAVNTVLARRRGLAAKFEVGADYAEQAPERASGEGHPPLDVERAIASLPDGARHVLVLVGLYGFSHDEAATQLGIAVGTSKAQLFRARQLLAARLELDVEDL